MENIDPNKKYSKKEQKAQREKALKGFQLLDDRMKLQNPIWSACTRGAFHMGMSDEERMKLIAINLVLQNGQLLDAQVQAGLSCQERDTKIKTLEARVAELEMLLSPKE